MNHVELWDGVVQRYPGECPSEGMRETEACKQKGRVGRQEVNSWRSGETPGRVSGEAKATAPHTIVSWVTLGQLQRLLRTPALPRILLSHTFCSVVGSALVQTQCKAGRSGALACSELWGSWRGLWAGTERKGRGVCEREIPPLSTSSHPLPCSTGRPSLFSTGPIGSLGDQGQKRTQDKRQDG